MRAGVADLVIPSLRPYSPGTAARGHHAVVGNHSRRRSAWDLRFDGCEVALAALDAARRLAAVTAGRASAGCHVRRSALAPIADALRECRSEDAELLTAPQRPAARWRACAGAGGACCATARRRSASAGGIPPPGGTAARPRHIPEWAGRARRVRGGDLGVGGPRHDQDGDGHLLAVHERAAVQLAAAAAVAAAPRRLGESGPRECASSKGISSRGAAQGQQRRAGARGVSARRGVHLAVGAPQPLRGVPWRGASAAAAS
mmetsp:Transcript_44224/g.127811  ORF Transcript_44224/g.127811 Transcript_44224/m.127811 type:complete len:260 (-) Transcript_44224:1017-1796(-)